MFNKDTKLNWDKQFLIYKSMRIYILKLENEPKYKIGFTKRSVTKRIKDLQTGCPDTIIPIFEFESKYTTGLESYLHRMYGHKRLEGEWFQLEHTDIIDIESKCKMFVSNMESLKKHGNPFI
jgi:hypothetical protein